MFLYALVVMMSALLLFLVQPLIGRYILPWFGGSSAVWSASQFFFQLLLLVGYVYSHVVVRRLARRRQLWVHGALVMVAVGLMALNATAWPTPITPDASWVPAPRGSPLIQIMVTLGASVGLPYFVLSTTSPLLQAWFAERRPGKSPYRLYALSNAGSILALLGYPWVLAPVLTTREQAWGWAVGFLVFAVGVGAIVLEMGREGAPEGAPAIATAARMPIGWGRALLWFGLATCGSVLLLGATNQMTQNVAAVPLLWVAPLALYLLTFVIAFAGDHPDPRWSLGLLLALMPLLRAALVRANAVPILVQLGTYALIVFAGCMVCHGALARLRPRAERLTSFYLVTAAGGAFGGLLVNWIAPQVFPDFWELPLGVVLCWLLAAVALLGERERQPQKHVRKYGWAVVLAFAGALYAISVVFAAVAAFNHATVDATRNFYGTQRVQTMALAGGSDGDAALAAYRLVHGTTIHGLQLEDRELRREPTSYFCPSSGVGLAMAQSMQQHPRHTVAVLGLGAGTLATYGRPDDAIVFYEIDPQVIAYAEGEGGFFSYLADSPAAVEIVQGDARLSLVRDLQDGGGDGYDLLVVDVFSGDSPPVHLLTREALALYLAHMAPDGLLAVNVSTTHVDLKPVIAGLAREAGLRGAIVEDRGDGRACFPSRWVVLAANPELLSGAAWTGYLDLQTVYEPGMRLWTDDYTNLLQVMVVSPR